MQSVRWPQLHRKKGTSSSSEELPACVCLCLPMCMYLPTPESTFLFKTWWKTIFCARHIYCHSTESWQSSVRVQSFPIKADSLHPSLSDPMAVQHELRTFCAQSNCFMRYKNQGHYPKPCHTTLLNTNTFSEMFERYCQERNLLYVIVKLLAYFASFCCLRKSLLLLHVSCKHVQTMP